MSEGVVNGSPPILLVALADTTFGGVTQVEAGVDDWLKVMLEVRGWLTMDDGIEGWLTSVILTKIKKLLQVNCFHES